MNTATTTVIIRSQKYPSIGLVVSDRPTIGGPGSWEFAMDVPYTVSPTVAEEIQQQIRSFRPAVRQALRVDVQAGDSAPKVAAGAVNAPAPPPEEQDSTVVEPEAVVEPVALTDEDHDLVEVEVGKLLAKATIAEREPLLNATAGNEDLPVSLRVAYLNAVVAADGIQQKLIATANEWLELLSA